jgi:hypothetical protein
MITETYPEIGTWYHYPAKSQKFMVTAVDDHTETIEIQYFDGTIDEIDLETWYILDVQRVETPEDWTGPMDNIEKDDLNPVGTEMLREDWDESYDESSDERRGGAEQDYEEDNFEDNEEDR